MDLLRTDRLPFLCRGNYYHEFRNLVPWGLVAGMLEGNVGAVVAAKTFGGGELLVWVASTSFVAMLVVSMFWGALCVGRPKIRLLTICSGGATLMVATVGATPGTPLGGWCFVAQMAAAHFFLTGTWTVRTGLWKANYPTDVRGQIAARLQMIRAVTGITAILIAAYVFDMSPNAYRFVYPAVALCGLVSILFLRKMRVRGEAHDLRAVRELPGTARQDTEFEAVSPFGALSPTRMIRRAVYVFRDDRRFARYCASLMCTGIGNLMVRAVVVIVIANHMLADPGRNFPAYGVSMILLDVLPRVLMLGLLARMGRLFDRVGVVRFRVVNGTFWMMTTVFGTAGTLAIVYADRIGTYALVLGVLAFASRSVFMGLASAGGSLAYNLGHLHFAKPQRTEVYMGIHASLTGLRGLTMPGLGILLWAWIGWPVWLIAMAFSALGVIGYVALAAEETRQATDTPG